VGRHHRGPLIVGRYFRDRGSPSSREFIAGFETLNKLGVPQHIPDNVTLDPDAFAVNYPYEPKSFFSRFVQICRHDGLNIFW
jgi:hypothetical protein